MPTRKTRLLLLTIFILLQSCVVYQTPNTSPVKKSPLFRNVVQEAAYQIDTLLNNPRTDMAFWGVKIQFANSDDVIYERNPRKLFMPASNMKLYTTAAALCLLGPQFRYETGFYSNGEVTSGTLNGDLIIKGSGDPSWSWRFYENNYDSIMVQFVDSLKAKGITRITGDIVGDDNYFDDMLLGGGWAWDNEAYYYNAQLSALSFNENYIDYKIYPDSVIGNPVRLESYPETSYLALRNDLITVHPDSSGRWTEGRDRALNQGWFEGEYSQSKGEGSAAITVENPTLFTVHVLKEYLERGGITVAGDPVDVDDLSDSLDYTGYQRLFTHQSPPLSDIICKVNKPSQNFIAETLQKTLGAEFGEEGSSYQGRLVERALFDSLGVYTPGFNPRDGSGLSRYNLIAPEATVSLLDMMWDHPQREIYLASLPVIGYDGTTRRLVENGAAYQNVLAKTGTISYARALSGYVWTQSGEPIIFSFMVNHHTVSNTYTNAMIVEMLEILSELP